MKKFFVFALVALFALALLMGCGQPEPEGADTAPAVEEPAAEAADTTPDDTTGDTIPPVEKEADSN